MPNSVWFIDCRCSFSSHGNLMFSCVLFFVNVFLPEFLNLSSGILFNGECVKSGSRYLLCFKYTLHV